MNKTKTTIETSPSTSKTPEEFNTSIEEQLAPASRTTNKSEYKMTPVFMMLAIAAALLLLIALLVTLGTYGALDSNIKTLLIFGLLISMVSFVVLIFVTEKVYYQAINQMGKRVAIGLALAFMVLITAWFVYSVGFGMIGTLGSALFAIGLIILGVVIGFRSFRLGTSLGLVAMVSTVIAPLLLAVAAFNSRA